ncbi:MAG: DUF4192 domain-containing protein [Haloechinothrix sp.]
MTQKNPVHGKTRIRLSEPADVLAAIPHMLGFRPVNSVVLLADTGQSRKEIGRRLRLNLPPADLVEPVARQLTESITQDQPSSVIIVIVGGGGDDLGARRPLPHAGLVSALRRELDARGVDQPSAMWVPEISAGARWRCYDHTRCGGVLPDPSSTVVAAETVGLGLVTYDSREDVQLLFKPDHDQLLRERARLIDAKFRDLEFGAARDWKDERGVAAIRAGLRCAHSGLLVLSDDQIAELAVALANPRLRDACLATALPADSEAARSAARLWQALARGLPAPERAEPACLAGFAAYLAGNGAFAGIALEVALAADPLHVLAGLLIRALHSGVHPERLHRLAEHDVGLVLWPDLEGQRWPEREKSA